MRLFIALDLPEENKEQIRRIQQLLQKLIPEARLTDTKKLHLTIAFLGEKPEEIKEKVIEIITEATKDIPPFTVTPGFIDGFPTLHHPRTIWIGVRGDIDKLQILRERIKDGLKDLGVEVDERRYTPHIAIAKISNFELSEIQEQKLQEMMLGHFGPVEVKSIKLFESIPSEGLHTHNTLAEIFLS